jgi:hypothetical protein
VNVVAVGHRIGLLEAAVEFVVERHIGDQLAGQAIAHLLKRRHPGVGQDRILQADLVERAEDIGTELDAGADLSKLVGLLQHAHRKALQGQCIGRDQSSDAAAHDQERQITPVCFCH